jgi:cobalamin biosynthesis protein CobD/CbiB
MVPVFFGAALAAAFAGAYTTMNLIDDMLGYYGWSE